MKIVTLDEFKQFAPDKMKKNNLFQSPRFFCDIYGLEPGQAQKGHVHGEQDKIYIVLDGRGTFQVGTEEQVLGTGQAVMAPSGEQHGVRNDTQQRLTLLVFVAPNPS
jgi:mannose-6-phosphate isomerase-like protein (cupin superfamily)